MSTSQRHYRVRIYVVYTAPIQDKVDTLEERVNDIDTLSAMIHLLNSHEV